ncbi:uncharacterized protein LOC129274397 [Lytechinus pictus]|uniref:uncharacterized protein LOC129274397 n=1 Tax=Lytechinus pictus TaxID=7653 RepID=UPI0030B9E0E5
MVSAIKMALSIIQTSSIILLFVCILLKGCKSQIQCAQTGRCTCTFNDQQKTKVNFGVIGLRNGKPKFDFDSYGQKGAFNYAFNPCYPFSAGTCKDVVSCQNEAEGPKHWDLGNPDPVSWETLPQGTIRVTYTATQEEDERTSVVSYVCDQTAINEPTFAVISEAPTRTYNMEVRTCAACSPAVQGCPTEVPSAPSSGLTGGGIVCIIFTVLVVVYIAGGILFQVFAKGASGKEIIPNVNFWSDFPGLVKDGFLFMISPCRRGGYSDM